MPCRGPLRSVTVLRAAPQGEDNTEVASATREPGLHGVAGIAVLAGPLRVDLLAEALENEARPAARGLADGDHRVELRLILRPPLFVIEQVGTEIHRAEIAAEPLPASAAMLAHQPMPLEQAEDDPRLPRRHARLLGDLGQWHGRLDRVRLE